MMVLRQFFPGFKGKAPVGKDHSGIVRPIPQDRQREKLDRLQRNYGRVR